MAQQYQISNNLNNIHKHIAPQILGKGFIKNIISLQMFTEPRRGEMFHILLVGEPSSGKTEILHDVSKIVPNSSFAGSDLTPVGLREKFEDFTNGILCMDEFDKLKKQVRNGMLETMQTGEITVDKHGNHDIIDAYQNILSACNPKSDFLNEETPVTSQVKFDPVLLSRFHLFIKFKPPETRRYPQIAENMGKNNDEKKRQEALKNKVYETRNEFSEITIPRKISRALGKYVKKLKSLSPMKKHITPRLIEGATSMLKANARRNRRHTVEMDDYKFIRDILNRQYR